MSVTPILNENTSKSYKIDPIPAFADNYLWCLSKHGSAYVVDPGEGKAVIKHLHQHKLTLAGILVTHHHYDHTDGIAELLNQYPDIPVFGPKNSPFQLISEPLVESNTLCLFNIPFTVIEVPGHTLDHIAYYSQEHNLLFCGDTLFRGGCGRVFEGTMAQMHTSLNKLAVLPEQTQVYPTHEYTLANLAFAKAVEADNRAIDEALAVCTQLRHQHYPTLPTTIAAELATNPFLRCHTPTVIDAAQQYAKQTLTDTAHVFANLREWKNNF